MTAEPTLGVVAAFTTVMQPTPAVDELLETAERIRDSVREDLAHDRAELARLYAEILDAPTPMPHLQARAHERRAVVLSQAADVEWEVAAAIRRLDAEQAPAHHTRST